MNLKAITLIFAALTLQYFATQACTTFTFKTPDGQIIYGRNFDFPSGLGHVHLNYRGVEKFSFVAPPEKPTSWISKYGSVTFNQNGRELPYGGMNEAGLIIEQMFHQEAKYPEPDSRAGLTELQWIQYQLDNCATVDEVLKTDAFLRISKNSVATLHFLVADAQGNSAVVEYIDGAMRTYSGSALPYSALANCSYETSLDYVEKKTANPAQAFAGWTENSSGRFKTAAEMIEKVKSVVNNPVEYAFEILTAVSQTPGTQWSIVYDITNKTIEYKTAKNGTKRQIQFSELDFKCRPQRYFVDIDNSNTTFVEFSKQANYALIDEVCNTVEFLRQIPPAHRMATSEFPEKFGCN